MTFTYDALGRLTGYSGTPVTVTVRLKRSLALAVMVIAFSTGACEARNDQGLRVDEEGCLWAAGETFDAVSWSPDGSGLALASTRNSDGTTVVRMTDPAGRVVSATTDPSIPGGPGWTVAAGPGWSSYWLQLGDRAEVWMAARDQPPTAFAVLSSPRVSYFSWGGDALLALETVGVGDSEQDRVIAVSRGVAQVRVLREFGVGEVVKSFAASPDGRNSVVAISAGPGTPVRFEVWGESEWTVVPPGTLVGEPSLLPDAVGIVYEDHDSGSLKRINRDGTSFQLVAADAAAARVSVNGTLAYATLEPMTENRICSQDLPQLSSE